MSLYAGLPPVDALNKWYAIRQKPASALTPEEKADIAGNMEGLSKENPDAWKVVKNGVEDPTSSDYYYAFNASTGQFERQEHHGWLSHPESWLQLGFGGALGAVGAASLIGSAGSAGSAAGSAGASAAGGGGLTATASPALGGTLASTQLAGGATLGGVAPSGAVAAELGGAVAPTVAAGAGIGLKQLLPSIISAGGGVAGTLIGAHANSEAANAQAAATEKALALQREIYQQQRADLAPYRTLGNNAAGRLSDLWGFPQDPSMVRSAQSVPVSQADPVHGSDIYLPNMNKNPALGPIGGNGTGGAPAGMIMVKAPDNSVRALSPADANRALALGATYA